MSSTKDSDNRVMGWNVVDVPPGEIAIAPKYEFRGFTVTGLYKDIDQESGIVQINNQSYHMTTIHQTFSALFDPQNEGDAKETSFKFNNVAFAFLRPPAAPGMGGIGQLVLLEFPDGSKEALTVKASTPTFTFPKGGFGRYFPDGVHVFPDGTKEYGVLTPAPVVTTFGEHANPQAGVTIMSDSVKLLVSR